MGLPNYPFKEPGTTLDMNACLLVQEGQQECWQNLVHELTARLATTEVERQKALTDNQRILLEYRQLEEKLEEAQANHQALLGASAAQAQQFSETLKQLRQNQAQIVQAEKMSSLGQLVAGVAHEINNPVNFIYGNLSHAKRYIQDLMQLLNLYQQHYPRPAPEIQEATDEIDLNFLMRDLPHLLTSMEVGADRIQKIVLSLRSFSRMDEAEVKEVDIHEGIESTLMILQNRLKAKPDHTAIRIVKDYGELPFVECYAGQLNQVLMNLLTNAIDALEEEPGARNQKPDSIQNSKFKIQNSPTPTIQIQTRLIDSKWLVICITDNGPGISESAKERLFDPFFTTKPVGKGTGLGLSISYQIITEKHHGSLRCISSPGQGAEFIIKIPARLNYSQLP
ncbi:sensor histidine kinase [Kovacikia minuta]|uniref:sensor histidine kinase n=1 Tax=Kovacikia minuta TaxID=2931930 RepID=UPI0036F2940E